MVDRERANARRRELYHLNPRKHVEKVRKWQKNNPEKVKEARRKWSEKNPNQRQEYYRKHPEKFKEMRFKMMMWRIGVKMTYQEFKKLLKKQGGKCAICRMFEKKRRMSVDHCHKTGKVRGLLCRTCNIGLGQFKDNPELLKKAIKYLTK